MSLLSEVSLSLRGAESTTRSVANVRAPGGRFVPDIALTPWLKLELSTSWRTPEALQVLSEALHGIYWHRTSGVL